MGKIVLFADLAGLVGQELGVSDWETVDQATVDAFARLTRDEQWIHVDVERAGRERGGTIAHGFMALSLFSDMSLRTLVVIGVSSGLNYGFDRVRFISPVPVGSRIRFRETLVSVEPRTAGLLMTRDCQIEVEGQDKPAVAARWLTIIFPEGKEPWRS